MNARDREDVERVTELLERLREPFPPEQIDKLPKPIKKNGEFGAKGSCKDCGGWHSLPAVHLDYVGHANLTKRLLDIDLFWSWEPVSFDTDGQPVLVRDVKGNPVGLWIRLTILGLTRLGYGSCEPKPEAVKELIGDALRNSAARFGVALDLWSKQDKHKASQDAGGEATTPRGRRRMGGAAAADRAPHPADDPSLPASAPDPETTVSRGALERELTDLVAAHRIETSGLATSMKVHYDGKTEVAQLSDDELADLCDRIRSHYEKKEVAS